MSRTVAIVTMGCARNEVDSEELAGRLAADGWTLVEDVESAEVAVVNTCGFIESAKKDSVDALLEANSLKGHGTTKAVVAVGCMAERYGKELAAALPEADAILGFDDYQDISARLQSIVSGNAHAPHTPRDRRALLPIAPVDRAEARDESLNLQLAPEDHSFVNVLETLHGRHLRLHQVATVAVLSVQSHTSVDPLFHVALLKFCKRRFGLARME